MRSALEEALSGQGRLVMLAGEPGIGKTRTAHELTAYAISQGARALWSCCHEYQGSPTNWLWVQAIMMYLQERPQHELLSGIGSGANFISRMRPRFQAKLKPPLGLVTPALAKSGTCPATDVQRTQAHVPPSTIAKTIAVTMGE